MQLILIFQIAFYMFWEIFWPLVLGFFLSAIIQTYVSHKKMVSVLGSDSVKCFTLAIFFGAASSSCSYAAVSLARSIFKKGATFTSSMIFEIASTNLVIEILVILLVLLGWQFALAEFMGGIIMVIIIALIFRFTLSKYLIDKAKNQAEKGLLGKMEGHAHMDMSLTEGNFLQKLFSKNGFTAVSHYFFMDVSSVWTDIAIGIMIAGLLAVIVPQALWQAFFFTNNPQIAFIEGPFIGPLIAIFSFVCSVGNIPLAAVLWNGGISFGGIVSFIFADLIVLPILNIYRKYYGAKVMLYILVSFYAAMVLAGYSVEIIFTLFNIIPTQRNIFVQNVSTSFNYTGILNIVFLALAIVLFIRFIRTGGPMMLKMMK